MYRPIYLCAALCALVWSGPASAIVQETNLTATSTATSVPVQTITITQKQTSTSKPVKSVKLTIRRNQTKTVRTTIDDDKGTVIDIVVVTGTGQERRVTIPLSTLLGGGPIDLGDGLTLQNNGPSTATPQMPMPYTWTGWYVGGMGVVNFGSFDWTEYDSLSGRQTNTNSKSGTGGGGGIAIGYNSDGWLGGAVTALFLNQSLDFNFPNNTSIGEKIKVILTATAQASWYPVPQFRLYALAGPALVEKEFFINFSTSSSENEWLWGGTLGAGVEYRITRTLSIFGQYQHIWVQDGHFDRPASSAFSNYTFQNDIDLVVAGVNVRF
jgi:outer membrane immunogenic protein